MFVQYFVGMFNWEIIKVKRLYNRKIELKSYRKEKEKPKLNKKNLSVDNYYILGKEEITRKQIPEQNSTAKRSETVDALQFYY